MIDYVQLQRHRRHRVPVWLAQWLGISPMHQNSSSVRTSPRLIRPVTTFPGPVLVWLAPGWLECREGSRLVDVVQPPYDMPEAGGGPDALAGQEVADARRSRGLRPN